MRRLRKQPYGAATVEGPQRRRLDHKVVGVPDIQLEYGRRAVAPGRGRHPVVRGVERCPDVEVPVADGLVEKRGSVVAPPFASRHPATLTTPNPLGAIR